MLENVRLSFQGIWSHKMRSFLTMLGIIIGIASIISIVSTIQGTNDQIRQNLIGAGNNAVEINLSQGQTNYPFIMCEPMRKESIIRTVPFRAPRSMGSISIILTPADTLSERAGNSWTKTMSSTGKS